MLEHNFMGFIWNILYFLIICKIFAIVTCGRCKSNTCLSGKTALITGGCSGIGLATALDLASRGCRVIIADVQDGQKAIESITRETSNRNVTYKYVDLKSFKSVRELAANIHDSEERLDILINNAGIASQRNDYTEDGIHELMQVNYFSHFLLTHLLIDILKKSAPSRIIFVSSVLAYGWSLSEYTLLPKESIFEKWQEFSGIYGNSKSAMAMASIEFAAKLEGTGVTSNALYPGMVRSNICRTAFKKDRRISLWLAPMIVALFGKTTEEGCQTAVQLACAKSLEKVSGKFFWDCIQFWQPPIVHDEELRKKIWKLSENIVKLESSERLK